ncbi:uncharacterized protein FIESC28_10922 [Fusarium coffeatum]|uniref:Uncharacterized protein n=1 Tax=Fusarium coffeatum TaxID=231269 RepID=A0A366QRP8_9HYPO|nr:uncharacterized protein FIESC28_10922 [Fusarium coffeatum]RBR06806.1 hypothetical protein FIESC28_10922 [Fusarium coffeatum]
MGFGQMTIPLYLSGFWAQISYPNGITFPHTFTPSDITEGQHNKYRGAKIAELRLRTDGWGLHGGHGGLFVVKFAISGRPKDHADLPGKNMKGSLSIGTSEWGFFSRPDKTNFIWQIEGQQRTFTASTPTLSYLDDSCLAVAYAPDEKKYVFRVSNQQDFIVKLLQGGVGAIISGHKLLWSTAAGWVAPIGGTAFAVVAWGASQIDGI